MALELVAVNLDLVDKKLRERQPCILPPFLQENCCLKFVSKKVNNFQDNKKSKYTFGFRANNLAVVTNLCHFGVQHLSVKMNK